MTQWSPSRRPVMRVSDAEREQAAALLREHWLAGRLDAAEFDERASEVWAARTDRELALALRELPAATFRPPADRGDSTAAVASLVLGIVGLTLFTISFGFLFLLVLPLSVTAWGLGRGVRRRPGARGRGQATAGMVLGMLGTALSVLWVGGCAAFLV